MAKIRVCIEGGVVTEVFADVPDVVVTVVDYDVEVYDLDELKSDADGELYGSYEVGVVVDPTAPLVDTGVRTLEGRLLDQTAQQVRPTDFVVEAGPTGVSLGFAGYGDAGSSPGYGRPVFIEQSDGRVVVRVWADINQEDPTHVIDLAGARESAFVDSLE